ncbi:ATP synthase subunit delta, mitochondrial-like [Trichosurus vulpecula]|uniref:ATP synthase subunit delta, mitochondrial-like n=1 Tax=Trichosurus vulpecula TaxID=9337 RepID=UPI00186B1B3C|nr:ATP synthase subunit delta, mitochondrial-like [Trichosurus vulpecula]
MLRTTLLLCCHPLLLSQALVPTPADTLAHTYAEAIPSQMSFTFTSPTKVYFNEANVKQVDVPTQSGVFGILTAHIPMLQALKHGMVAAHAKDGTATKHFVSSGSVTVNAYSSGKLLAEEAVALDMLDLVATRSNMEKGHSDLSGASDEAAWAKVQIQIEANEAIVKALES